MKQFQSKLKLIFLPFVFVAIGTIGSYTFLNWLLIIKLNLFALDEDFILFFIPMGLVFVPVFIWLRPRLKLLKFKTKGRGDPLSGMMMLAWASILASNCIAQTYLEVATGKLTNLDSISEIAKLPKTKYYEVKHFYIDKKQVRVKTNFEISGKHNEDFDMAIYTAIPVFDKQPSSGASGNSAHIMLPDSIKKILIVLNGKPISFTDLSKISPEKIESLQSIKGKAASALFGARAAHGALLIKTKKPFDVNSIDPPIVLVPVIPSAWIALKYQKTINNRLSQSEKEDRFKAFAAESQKDFDSKPLNDFIYLDRMGVSKDRKKYVEAVNSKENSITDLTILKPVNEAFEARFGTKLPWIFGSFGIGATLFLIILLFIPLRDIENIDSYLTADKPSSAMDDLKNIFVPREGYYFTPIIINLNLLIYIVMVCAGLGFITFSSADLLKWGANYRPAIQNGEYWRLLTNVFLHGGLLHVLFNMYGLMFVGIFLESLMGGKRYLSAYLFTGILASIASAWWHPATVSIGASGAIFGMYGIFLALLTTNLFPSTFKKSFLISTSVFVGYNLLNGLAGGIDNAAHIGGLISGLIIGYALYPSLKRRAREVDAEAETQQLIDEMTGKKDGE
ncbi:rhomboid family protein [Mucilaginibacter sp. FT3.2]|uniref:rhomboid family protein n=1 Tax=Mucilaginibacter sp. FT3.2 TaxID=2723090 RepID=UPI00160CFEB5|nr:rhomboid family intramembrane serine protease [Mucilaginibacter sp. FT3.2]MBB6233442.1 membrane associated rhomboid family serine protease [Mucilaginibacter sp. FT3.2]